MAIDEFPYLLEEDASIASILQSHWDTTLNGMNITLILSGSSIGMVEKGILGGKSPLYGRRTGQILLGPFSFETLLSYIGDFKKAVGVYSVFGGTPAYIKEYNKKTSLIENIKQLIARQDAFMHNDVEFLLRTELREPRYYFAILKSIAKGNTKFAKIINDTGISKSIVSKYLAILENMMLVKRKIPVTENVLRSRNGIYIINDNFIDFWFRYIYAQDQNISTKNLLTFIDNDLNNYISGNLRIYAEGPLWRSEITKT